MSMTPNPGNELDEEPESVASSPFEDYDSYEELRPKNEPRFFQKIRDIEKSIGFLTPLRWPNVFYFFFSHVILISWLAYDLLTGKFGPKWQTWIQSFIIYIVGSFGVTAGIHRYWSHRSYKAEWPLRCILLICYIISGEVTVLEWARDHRVHHKFTETMADPYNSKRGFFFAHMGWLMMKRHPAVLREGRKLDVSDLTNDPLVQFQTKYFVWLKIIFCFTIPTIIPPLLWGERWEQAILIHFFLALIIGPHLVFSVNSFAHYWGNKPYDPNIRPVNNWSVALFTLGEGWHNYHHTFPWDYKAAELPYFMNLTTLLLDGFAKLGWAHHMKTASPQIIQSVIKNRVHKKNGKSKENTE